ncbi:hypothetical protein Clacol_006082 [Clathrus columnatus]|uniref:HNH nuclease domain-containing protein n=1 Tax=Clathrus columnatus TaxID=1419009 RepID=A0AAV5AGN2_9AGAM|nr:hypothetical protein Clacol_006082 [Clathrus columnatus]
MTQMATEYSETSYDEDRSHYYRAPPSESAIKTSPSEILWSQTISPTLERRMNKNVYKDGRRCLIENTLNDESLQYVHCLSRRLESRRASINDLEFSWGMKRGTLNLDTRLNVFCLSAKFSALWEDYKWILLPEDHILDCYYTAATKGQKFPDIGKGPYKYRFVAHPDMKSVAIHRQIIIPDKGSEDLRPEHFMFSSFPFKNLGTLTSHVHPKFAICHVASRKPPLTTSLMFEFTQNDRDVMLAPIIRCIKIVAMWNPSLYEESPNLKFKAFFKTVIDPDDARSETSDRTAVCRLRSHMSDNRLIKEYGYVYVEEEDGAVRLNYKEDAPHLLTTNKLRIFEKQMNSRQPGKRKWKGIQSWRSTISGEPEGQKD